MSPEKHHSIILASPEYYVRRGGGTPTGYVTAVYQDRFGRSPDPGALVWELAVAREVTRLLEGLLDGYYELFLQPQADAKGMTDWLAQLNRGLPFRRIGQGFMASDEFWSAAASNG